jgi:hypothetical protein
MGRFVLCASVVAICLVTGGSGQDRKSSAEEKLYPIGSFAGKILKVAADGKEFTLRVYGKSAEVTFRPGNPASC